MKRLYEGMFILDATAAAADWEALVGQVHGILERYAGEVRHAEKWAERKFAYEIKRQQRGIYYLVYFDGDPDQIDDIRRDCAINEAILRELIVNRDGSTVEELLEQHARYKASAEEDHTRLRRSMGPDRSDRPDRPDRYDRPSRGRDTDGDTDGDEFSEDSEESETAGSRRR